MTHETTQEQKGLNTCKAASLGFRRAPAFGKRLQCLSAAILEQPGVDEKLIAAALGDIARARGMMQVARKSGLAREALYRALSTGGNPSFATILKVTRALGLKLHWSAA